MANMRAQDTRRNLLNFMPKGIFFENNIAKKEIITNFAAYKWNNNTKITRI